ncbi:FAD-binding oxidoreductase [Cellulomonas cellasea]|uniref:FAD/FMN-containing dehydrogenase n=1 Tax=Cellulomonas cellasea TaxID=43670 RepID=A0A7W4UFR0_9CELL|nr:FAD-binding oxidoreductase [Cellulomonas cellasea]MBB2922743.1 FAD/FMN-containing dehydrogenase [Cellulomonas cellasea]
MTQMTGSDVGARLRERVRGQVWQRKDAGYDAARTVWNGAVDRRPAVVVRCADADDARTALLVAREHGVALVVRGGGHDWAGRAVLDGGVVLDLSAMRAVRVDAGAGVAHAQGGALVADVVDPAAAQGLGTATAVVRSVGMAGMTMAGGYGGLVGRFGLALDNLVSADVLLPDGTHVTAGPDGDPELLWALRGGGGNFGVVTAARYRLHPLGPVLGGMVLYPHEQAVDVLRGYRDVLAGAPDELTVMAGFVTGPTGTPAVFVAPTWSGDLAAGERAVAPLTRLGTPLGGGVAPLPYPELIRMFEAGSAPGRHYALGTRWLPGLTDDAIRTLADAATTSPSPSSLLALHHFHGAAARVALDATAFALRRDHLLAEVIASWAPDDADPAATAAAHHAWVSRVASALAPGALPGGYPNILGPEDADRTRLGFGANADRLLAAKRRYDPDGALSAVAAIGG